MSSHSISLESFTNKFGPLEEMSQLYLMNIISNHQKEDRIVLLDIPEIKQKITSEAYNERDYWAYFRRLLDFFSVDELLILFDEETLKGIFNDKEGYKYIFYAALCEKNLNKTVECALKDDQLFSSFFKLSDRFYSLFSNLNYDLFKNVITKMKAQDFTYSLEFVGSTSLENQIKLLNETFDDDTLVKLVNNFSHKACQYFFLHHEKAAQLFDRFDIKNLIWKGIEFNSEIIQNKKFFELLKDTSFVSYRKYINSLEVTQNLDDIEENVNKYYEELLSSYNYDAGMFNEYVELLTNPQPISKAGYIMNYDVLFAVKGKPKEEAEKYLRELTNKKLSEVIVDALFKDNIYNVWLNIKEMLRFNSKLGVKKITDDRIKFYEMILNIDKMTPEEKIALYRKMQNQDIASVFYDDVRSSKNISYEMIKNSLFNINDDTVIDVEQSKKYGVKVIDMRDKEFYMLIKGMDNYHQNGATSRGAILLYLMRIQAFLDIMN